VRAYVIPWTWISPLIFLFYDNSVLTLSLPELQILTLIDWEKKEGLKGVFTLEECIELSPNQLIFAFFQRNPNLQDVDMSDV
jgi:hypothetical protein